MKYTSRVIVFSSFIFVGCNNVPQIPQPHVPNDKNNFVSPKDGNLSTPMADTNATLDANKTKIKPKRVYKIPKPPKKHIKLKEVHDNDFTPEYMYPGAKKQPTKIDTTTAEVEKEITVPTVASNTMSESECISMIGQERFDRYVQMLGSTNGAIKRCQMIKASRN